MMIKTRKPAHPGGIINRQYLQVLNLPVATLAKRLGVSPKTISNIVNEHSSITPDLALRLSKAFGTSAELWMNLQQNFDLWAAARKSTDWKNVEPVFSPPTVAQPDLSVEHY